MALNMNPCPMVIFVENFLVYITMHLEFLSHVKGREENWSKFGNFCLALMDFREYRALKFIIFVAVHLNTLYDKTVAKIGYVIT